MSDEGLVIRPGTISMGGPYMPDPAKRVSNDAEVLNRVVGMITGDISPLRGECRIEAICRIIEESGRSCSYQDCVTELKPDAQR